jgi:ubiquinone/menaquinone biosynthesis C-methylase UbiE
MTASRRPVLSRWSNVRTRSARGPERRFWTEYQPGFRAARSPVGTRAFFEEVTAQRSIREPHIPDVVGFHRWAGRTVLEAGCGIGTDGARFAAAGARYTGLDFSTSALDLARTRFRLDGFPGRFVQGSVTALPFATGTFDLVFSHGVVHHVRDTEAAIREFHRVLKPGGTALVMVYHRRSFNYLTIMVLRRALVLLLLLPGAVRLVSKLTGESEEVLAGHRVLLSEHGLRYILDGSLFLSHNTDGPGNPLSKVYSRREADRVFGALFPGVTTDVRYLNLRLYPGGARLERTVLARRLERRFGWHLYVEARKQRATGPVAEVATMPG